jgi:hypothetical protein
MSNEAKGYAMSRGQDPSTDASKSHKVPYSPTFWLVVLSLIIAAVLLVGHSIYRSSDAASQAQPSTTAGAIASDAGGVRAQAEAEGLKDAVEGQACPTVGTIAYAKDGGLMNCIDPKKVWTLAKAKSPCQKSDGTMVLCSSVDGKVAPAILGQGTN